MKRFFAHATTFILALLLGMGATVYWFRHTHESHTLQPPLPPIFSDFELVAESSTDSYVPKHDAHGKAFPATLEIGRTYILHHQPALSDAAVFEQTIERMRSRGINISEADDGSRIREDGLAFRITFQDGVYAGYLQRWLPRADPDARPGDRCPVSDYILVITQARVNAGSAKNEPQISRMKADRSAFSVA